MDKDTRLEIRLPAETKAQLADLSKKQDVTMAEWIRREIKKAYKRIRP